MRTVFFILLFCVTVMIQSSLAQTPVLHRFDLSDEIADVKQLPFELREISGLAAAPNNLLYAHDDEIARVYILDPKSGRINRYFDLGNTIIRADFEGIAVTDQHIWLVTSDGTLYEFTDPGTQKQTKYNVYTTPLTKKNNIEGLCFDPDRNELLLACKDDAGTGKKDERAVYSFSIREKKLLPRPRFVFTADILSRVSEKKKNGFSGLERHPKNGTFFLLSSKGRYIIEVSAEGTILKHVRINKQVHPQPEGITFLQNGELVIADEGKRQGKLTIYSQTTQ